MTWCHNVSNYCHSSAYLRWTHTATPLIVCHTATPLIVCRTATPSIVCHTPTPLIVCHTATPLIVRCIASVVQHQSLCFVLVTPGIAILLLLKVAAADGGGVLWPLFCPHSGHKPITCSSLLSNVIQTFGMGHYPIATLSRDEQLDYLIRTTS